MPYDPRRDGPHKIEVALLVPLKIRHGRWVADGTETDQAEPGPVNVNCTCGDKASCEAALRAADELELPSGRALADLLAAAAAEEEQAWS
ncbi:hypothetical protein [Amycolatopsis sp. NPDC004079]|uniref:hypothetical protein n=1 Tax=Amycolatopsis sp. NPDC004079 TaxID=3154549 RepID=UPI0033A8ED52